MKLAMKPNHDHPQKPSFWQIMPLPSIGQFHHRLHVQFGGFFFPLGSRASNVAVVGVAVAESVAVMSVLGTEVRRIAELAAVAEPTLFEVLALSAKPTMGLAMTRGRRIVERKGTKVEGYIAEVELDETSSLENKILVIRLCLEDTKCL